MQGQAGGGWFGCSTFLLGLLALFTATNAQAGDQALVIAQVYGGGGNSGSTYKNDYIVVHNRSGTAVNLAGYSVQYNSGGGTGAWQVTTLPALELAPGRYFLIQEAQGTGGVTDLPMPDAFGTINMSTSAGRVALVSSNTALTGPINPAASPIVDFVGYGATAINFEGSGPAPAGSNVQEIVRLDAGARDNDNNAADFTTQMANPRNSSSQPVVYNFPPTARPDAVSTLRNTPVVLPASRLVLNDFDPEGGALVVTDVGILSSRGGVVSLNGGNVTYMPPVSYLGQDVLNYVLSDGSSSVATGVVNITVTDRNAPTPSLISVTREAGGTRIRWLDLTNRSYGVEFNDDLIGPWQSVASSITADGSGVLEYFDPTSPAPARRHYRTVLGP